MAPKDYIAARSSSSSNSEENDNVGNDVTSIVDGQPYYPDLIVDANDMSSIRRVVAKRFLQEDLVMMMNGDHQDHDEWPVTVVSGGITNQLFRVDISTSTPGDTTTGTTTYPIVLVRIFGAEGMIDRDVETSTFAALAKQNLAPKYYGRFANGRLEEFLPKMMALTPQQMAHPEISKAIAQQLALLHNQFNVPSELTQYHSLSSQQPNMWTQLQDWMDQAWKAKFQNDNDTQRALQLKLDQIPNELKWLRQDVVPSNAPVAFCHNDLLAANILYSSTATSTNNIQLIDFEYGGINYKAFDIANHFNEYAGGTDDGNTNYDWFPTKQHQMEFLKTYLQSSQNHNNNKINSNNNETTDLEIEEWYKQIQPFILANHLYWGLWAVNQAATEGCKDFDYLLFATNRINRYYECKEK